MDDLGDGEEASDEKEVKSLVPSLVALPGHNMCKYLTEDEKVCETQPPSVRPRA